MSWILINGVVPHHPITYFVSETIHP